jgi:amidase
VITATQLAGAVRVGAVEPVRAAAIVLRRIAVGVNGVDAFRKVRAEAALDEAWALRDRADLAQLPLAGVPIAVKDVTAVAGEYAWEGYAGEMPQPFPSDSDIVARLRAAGAVIVGLTRTPQLCLWPTTDSVDAIVRNPWATAFTAGGSSGGSAAAVAAGLGG